MKIPISPSLRLEYVRSVERIKTFDMGAAFTVLNLLKVLRSKMVTNFGTLAIQRFDGKYWVIEAIHEQSAT